MYHKNAIECKPGNDRAWHNLALANFAMIAQMDGNPASNPARMEEHVAMAVHGLIRAISLGSEDTLQDALRLIRLWFAHGHLKSVCVVTVEEENEKGKEEMGGDGRRQKRRKWGGLMNFMVINV